MFDKLILLGWSLIVFAILIGVGSVVLGKLGSAVAGCPTGFVYVDNATATASCCYGGNITCTGSNYTDPSSGTTNSAYMVTQLGSTSGLASWTPAIIALAIGLLFIGAFMLNRSKNA